MASEVFTAKEATANPINAVNNASNVRVDKPALEKIVGRHVEMTYKDNYIEAIDSITNDYYDYTIRQDEVSSFGIEEGGTWHNLDRSNVANPKTVKKIQDWMRKNNFRGFFHYVIDTSKVKD